MSFKKLQKWKKSYGVKNLLLRSIYSKLPIIPVSNNELLRRMNWQLRAKKRLEKFLVIKGESPELEEKNKYPRRIWWLWFQGRNNAPDIVKKCFESIQYYAENMQYTLTELNEKNLFQYVHLPECIVEKWKKGIIGNANFSDLCRVSLLVEYGGIWIDSTVLLTGEINKEILESDFFFFKASFMDMTVTKISNWFMTSKKAGNSFLLSVRESMFNYWSKNDYMDDYFIFHLVVSALSEKAELKEMFEEIPYFTNTYPHLLGSNLINDYSKNKFEHILKCSNIHKLTYKNMEGLPQSSVYHYLLERNL